MPRNEVVFTGIVEKTVRLISVNPVQMGLRLTIERTWKDVSHGESIAINGVCLTIAALDDSSIGFDVIKETLEKTNLGLLKAGDGVHVERALRAGDRFDGHFVQGHVDGTGELVGQVDKSDEVRLTIRPPGHLSKYLAPKGSISIDGVSLTIAAMNKDTFDVALIPTTIQITQLSKHQKGWKYNLEFDVLSKQIVTFLELRQS